MLVMQEQHDAPWHTVTRSGVPPVRPHHLYHHRTWKAASASWTPQLRGMPAEAIDTSAIAKVTEGFSGAMDLKAC